MRTIVVAAMLALIAGLASFEHVPVFAATQAEDFAASLAKEKAAADKSLLGGCEYDPYQKLTEMRAINGGARVVPVREGQTLKDGLDPALACRLSKFIEHVRKNGCNASINSAYRSEADQRRACSQVCGNPAGCSSGCASFGSSCHNYGLAVDLSPSSCMTRFAPIARDFGLSTKHPGYGNPIHYQCAEHAGGASRRFCSAPCNGGAAISFSPSGPLSPLNNGIGDQFRNMLGQPQMPPQPPPQQQPPPPQQPPTPQQPGTTQPGQYFDSGSTGSGGTTGGGTTGGGALTPAPSSTSLGDFDTPNQASYHSSVADQLLQLAYDTPLATSTQTGTSTAIDIDGNDVTTLTDTAYGDEPYDDYTVQGQTTLSPTNTFASSDLSDGGQGYEVVATYRGESTGLIALLIQLRDAFAAILEIMRPMGIRTAIAPTDGDEHFE